MGKWGSQGVRKVCWGHTVCNDVCSSWEHTPGLASLGKFNCESRGPQSPALNTGRERGSSPYVPSSLARGWDPNLQTCGPAAASSRPLHPDNPASLRVKAVREEESPFRPDYVCLYPAGGQALRGLFTVPTQTQPENQLDCFCLPSSPQKAQEEHWSLGPKRWQFSPLFPAAAKEKNALHIHWNSG